MPTTVAILGGGVAGMTAAHELAQRGFEVHLYERREIVGGKARSFTVPGTGDPGLPAEHGFRFFPGFYWHLQDTMERIPDGDHWVIDNLVDATQLQIARAHGESEIFAPAGAPRSPSELARYVSFLITYATQLRIPVDQLWYFVTRLTILMTSCEERLYEEIERQSWWDFTRAGEMSPDYQKYLADGMTRTLVAARARRMSARTGGSILLQLLYDMSRPHGRFDRVLNAPTHDAWMEPWQRYLEGELDVRFHFGTTVTGFACADGEIAGVATSAGTVAADHYIAALPVEVLRDLLTAEMKALDPGLKKLANLELGWMNGVMYYLGNDVRIAHGHSLYIDSQWALTSISQKQFWPQVDLEDMHDGTVRGILSVDVSEWNRAGSNGKKAKDCDEDEVKAEVWAQLAAHLNDDPVVERLEWGNVRLAYVDPAIDFTGPAVTNAEPILINTKGSWHDRPRARTRIPNLFLASDYVRTFTDLATMEAANEAARRAVRCILESEQVPENEWCELRRLWEPPFLELARELDRWRFQAGQPHHLDELDPAMPVDFATRPANALQRLEGLALRPRGLPVMPAGWPHRPPGEWPFPPRVVGR